MTWIEPKEDWKMGDAPSNGDFNRIEKNAKHIFDMIGAVNGIATLDAGGKVPQAQLPAAVEIKTIRIPSTYIPPGGSVSRTVTFDYYHKAAIVVARRATQNTGFVGVIINASEGINDTPGIFSVTAFLDGDTKTSISRHILLNRTIFGPEIGYELSFANKIFTFTLKNNEEDTNEGKADVNIIAL